MGCDRDERNDEAREEAREIGRRRSFYFRAKAGGPMRGTGVNLSLRLSLFLLLPG